MESKKFEKAKGTYKVSFLADLDGGRFVDISFGMVEVDNVPVCGVMLTPYGLKCDYDGNGKTTVKNLVKSLETSLASEYNLTYEPEPEPIEMPHVEDMDKNQNEEQ